MTLEPHNSDWDLNPAKTQIGTRTHCLFWPCCTACGLLVPRPGIEPRLLAVTARRPNHWNTREFPPLSFFFLAALGCVGSSLLHAGFLQLWQAGATLRCSVQASHCGGFSCCRAWALGMRASVVVAHGLSSCGSWALECRLSSCGTRAQLLLSMWNLPGPGLEPVSPALAG